ncbi:MAG: hypothetical protein KJO08_06100 [Gammaproteobacteria bacterium]|nr:hypothetical protein [Gammaproteobacteria bacterium]
MLYIQGWMVVRKLDPNATQVMGSFIEKTLGSDFAAASTIKIPLSDGITIKNAVHAMKQRAMGHGMKLVDRLKLHKEVTEKTRPYLEVFSFQAPKINPLILGYNWEIATYMPYRIALYQDKGERAWLATMDLGLLIHGAQEFEPDFKSQMIAVKDQLLDIMAAGATGGQ